MENLLSASQLAKRLGISLRLLEQLIARGEVPPYIRLGRLRRWSPAHIEKWIEDQVQAQGADGSETCNPCVTVEK